MENVQFSAVIVGAMNERRIFQIHPIVLDNVSQDGRRFASKANPFRHCSSNRLN